MTPSLSSSADGAFFAGDVLFNAFTPIGWEGANAKWVEAIDLILAFEPQVVVPGHGALCGCDETKAFRSYLEYVYAEARPFFDMGLTPLDAAKKIELPSPYTEWTEPERLIWNVARAYREFRGEPWDAPFGDRLQLFRQGMN
jgi:glyoxylase-like metal-dependent hydrolase (beta-lactamase superfamily II)